MITHDIHKNKNSEYILIDKCNITSLYYDGTSILDPKLCYMCEYNITNYTQKFKNCYNVNQHNKMHNTNKIYVGKIITIYKQEYYKIDYTSFILVLIITYIVQYILRNAIRNY